MKTVRYFLEIAAYFSGLIVANLDYVKANSFPNRSNIVDDNSNIQEELDNVPTNEDYIPTKGTEQIIKSKEPDNIKKSEPINSINDIRTDAPRNGSGNKSDISEQSKPVRYETPKAQTDNEPKKPKRIRTVSKQ